MKVTVNNKDYDLYFGLDFLDEIERKHSPTMEAEGQEFKIGTGGLPILEAKMNQYSQSALADVLVAGTTTGPKKLNRRDIETHFNNLTDDEFFQFYDDVLDEMGKSSTLRRAEKAQKRLNQANNPNGV